MLEIKEITLTDYYFLMFGMRTTFTDICARSASQTKGCILAALENNKPIGFICFNGGDDVRLLCGYTKESHRKKGVFTALLSEGVSRLPRPVIANISLEHKCFEPVSAALVKTGFTLSDRCVIFRGDRKDYPEWEKYMERSGNGMCAYLERRGFTAEAFSRLSGSALDYIKYSTENEYEGGISAQCFFENPAKNMDMDCSFAAVKDGIPEAYVLVSRPDESSFIFEIISASKKYASTGVVLLPFAYSMNAFKESGSDKIRYAMFESNLHANAFRKKLLEKVTSTQKNSNNYTLKG